MDRYIVSGKPATHLSETIDRVYLGDECWQWVVADISGYISCREDAVELAREWFPDLIDDEDE